MRRPGKVKQTSCTKRTNWVCGCACASRPRRPPHCCQPWPRHTYTDSRTRSVDAGAEIVVEGPNFVGKHPVVDFGVESPKFDTYISTRTHARTHARARARATGWQQQQHTTSRPENQTHNTINLRQHRKMVVTVRRRQRQRFVRTAFDRQLAYLSAASVTCRQSLVAERSCERVGANALESHLGRGVDTVLRLRCVGVAQLGGCVGTRIELRDNVWRGGVGHATPCLLYTSPSPRDRG